MEKYNFKYVYRFFCNLIIIAMMSATFTWIWLNEINILMDRPFEKKGHWLIVFVYALLVLFSFYAFEGFTIGINRISYVSLSQALSITIVNVAEVLVSILVVGRLKYMDEIAWALFKIDVLDAILLLLFSIVTTKLYRRLFPPYNMLAINGNSENNLIERVSKRRDKFIISDSISCEMELSELANQIESYDAVLINDIPSETRNDILKICYELDKRVYFTPKLGDVFVRNSSDLHLFDTPIYFCRNENLSIEQRFFKRLLDIVVSLIGIVITSPIMLVTAIVIFAYDRGPVFYRQNRCTKNGKIFKMVKFRSMIVDAEKDGQAVLAQSNDDRITPIGKFIRATRIDELPQFFNILSGSMSVVGPRPERPEIIEKYKKEMPEFDYRLRVKAGLTGLAQIYGKYNTSSYDKLKFDMMYVENCSVVEDIRLILLTLRVILQKEATEGLESGKKDAMSRGSANHN